MIARRLFLAAPLLIAGCPATFVWPEGHQRGGEGSPDAGPDRSEPDKGEPPDNGEGDV